jgi:hypothetical protein
VTSVNIILIEMPIANILFHLFNAHSRIFVVSALFQHVNEADVEVDSAGTNSGLHRR